MYLSLSVTPYLSQLRANQTWFQLLNDMCLANKNIVFGLTNIIYIVPHRILIALLSLCNIIYILLATFL